MKLKSILICLLIGCGLALQAQDYKVIGMESLPTDMTAREHIKTDENGRQCAVFRIATQNITSEQREGFYFQGDYGSYVVERSITAGEIWVWVSPGLKTLKIFHNKLGRWELHTANYGIMVEALHTYKIVLQGTTVSNTNERLEVTQQYLAFQISPTNAVLEVEGELWEVASDGSAMKFVNFGTYNYRVQAPNYHPEIGTVTVNDPENTKKVPVNLNPNFGWIEVTGNENLQGASVYVDNSLIGKAPCKSEAIGSGQHTVRIAKEMYSNYSEVVTVIDNQTTSLSPTLEADYAEVTLSVDANAEIWVNNEKKGTRTWTGPLSSGTYKIECKQANHETTMITKEITPQMAGQTIKLESPRPIYGSLNVVSTPNFATLYIDGKEIGETPKFIKDLLIGTHELRLTKKGCAPIQKTIVIKKGETLEVKESLATGKSITVKTDRSGDKVYVDNTIVGETPITTSVGFGQHTIKVTRNNVPVEKTITIAEHDSDRELLFEFGRLITIKTDQTGDAVFVDGNKVGVSPLSIDLPFGRHAIRAERKKKYDEMDIHVNANDVRNQYTLTLHGETPSHFVENGVNFATLDFAYSPAPQTSFGATFGSVKKIGWFVSATSNFNFTAMNADQTADAQGLVDGEYPSYIGKSCSTRISAMGGVVIKIAGPLYLRAGVGYGSWTKSWYTNDGHLVKISKDSYDGIDFSIGTLFNLKGFTISADAVTTNFGTVEAKIGLGYCWKRK